MFIEKQNKQQTHRMFSMRMDMEMYYALKALSDQTGIDTSTLGRLAVAQLIEKARKLPQPVSWDDLKQDRSI